MNILIEGSDCAGKSTLVKELKNRLSLDAISLHHKKGAHQFSRYLQMYSFLDQTVIERGHISEIVYSNLYKRENPFTENEQSILDNVMREKMLVIHASPSLADAKQRYLQRQNTYQSTKVAELEKCISLFDAYFDKADFEVLTYRSENWDELDKIVAKIKEHFS